MGKIYFEVMKDDMFEEKNKKLDTYDSDVDEPDPDLFYRIINTPIPKMPKLPKLPNLRQIRFHLHQLIFYCDCSIKPYRFTKEITFLGL